MDILNDRIVFIVFDLFSSFLGFCIRFVFCLFLFFHLLCALFWLFWSNRLSDYLSLQYYIFERSWCTSLCKTPVYSDKHYPVLLLTPVECKFAHTDCSRIFPLIVILKDYLNFFNRTYDITWFGQFKLNTNFKYS